MLEPRVQRSPGEKGGDNLDGRRRMKKRGGGKENRTNGVKVWKKSLRTEEVANAGGGIGG